MVGNRTLATMQKTLWGPGDVSALALAPAKSSGSGTGCSASSAATSTAIVCQSKKLQESSLSKKALAADKKSEVRREHIMSFFRPNKAA